MCVVLLGDFSRTTYLKSFDRFSVKNKVLHVVVICALVLLSGCASSTQPTPTAHQTPNPGNCSLQSWIEPKDSATNYYVMGNYTYEELSPDVKFVFKQTVDRGSFSTSNDSLDPQEFNYYATAQMNLVQYENETYQIVTQSGEYC